MNAIKKVNIKDIAFLAGFIGTILWGFASYFSIKASKEHIKRLEKELENE